MTDKLERAAKKVLEAEYDLLTAVERLASLKPLPATADEISSMWAQVARDIEAATLHHYRLLNGPAVEVEAAEERLRVRGGTPWRDRQDAVGPPLTDVKTLSYELNDGTTLVVEPQISGNGERLEVHMKLTLLPLTNQNEGDLS